MFDSDSRSTLRNRYSLPHFLQSIVLPWMSSERTSIQCFSGHSKITSVSASTAVSHSDCVKCIITLFQCVSAYLLYDLAPATIRRWDEVWRCRSLAIEQVAFHCLFDFINLCRTLRGIPFQHCPCRAL